MGRYTTWLPYLGQEAIGQGPYEAGTEFDWRDAPSVGYSTVKWEPAPPLDLSRFLNESYMPTKEEWKQFFKTGGYKQLRSQFPQPSRRRMVPMNIDEWLKINPRIPYEIRYDLCEEELELDIAQNIIQPLEDIKKTLDAIPPAAAQRVVELVVPRFKEWIAANWNRKTGFYADYVEESVRGTWTGTTAGVKWDNAGVQYAKFVEAHSAIMFRSLNICILLMIAACMQVHNEKIVS